MKERKESIDELHARALEAYKHSAAIIRRIHGIAAGHRRFLLALLERRDGREAKRPYPNNVEGEV